VVGHGRYPATDEGRVLSAWVVVGVALALALRVASDWLAPPMHSPALAKSAALWIAAWLAWSLGAVRRIAIVPGPPAPASRASG